MKVVINRCYGGFGLSESAFNRYNEITGGNAKYHWDIERNDPALVQVVEELGDEANSKFSELVIIEIPKDISWMVIEDDGMEHIAESHRIWY